MIYSNTFPRKVFFSLTFIILAYASSFGQVSGKILDKYLEAYHSAKQVPSICAGAAINGKFIWTGSSGYADLENSVKANSKTVYRIASVSKPITAIAVMQLVEKGKIKLDEDIRTYVSFFPKKKWNITVRNILTHTSGIRSYRPGEFDNKNYYTSLKEAIAVFSDDSLETKPGSKYSYNTIAYNLLAAAVENVSGFTFGEYLKKNIFEPAGMKSTNLEYQSDLVVNRAHGYIKSGDTIRNAPLADLSFKYAGGGIISTVEDLIKLGNALLENKILTKASIDSMTVPTVLDSGEKMQYGLGLGFGVDSLKGRYYAHAGGGTGFSSHFLVCPDSKSVFVHLINVRDNILENPSEDIATLVLTKENKDQTLDKIIKRFTKK